LKTLLIHLSLLNLSCCSEAKGSFAFAASPHGDSVESSGKPGNSLCREGNTADNLMLLDGDTSNIGGEKLPKRGTKRANAAQAEQFTDCDGQNNAKEEDSGLFRLGPKSQAYARRRSKSARDNSNSALVRHPPVPPVSSQKKDDTGLIPEAKTEDNGVSSVGDSKPNSPNCQNMLKNAPLNDNVEMDTGGVQAIYEGDQTSKNELSNSNNGNQAMEISPNSVTDNSHLTVGDQMATATASAVSPDAISKEAASNIVSSLPSISNEILKEAQTPEKAGNSPSTVSAVDIHADSMDNKGPTTDSAVKSACLNENEVDPTHAYATNAANEHPGQNEDLAPVKAGEMVDEGLNKILPEDKDDKKDSQLEVSSQPVALDDSSRQPELSCSVGVKDERELCNNAVDAQKDTKQLATSNEDKGNKEECSDSHRNNTSESSGAQKLACVTVPPASITGDAINPVENDVEKSTLDQEKIAKKECEDSIVAKKDHEDAILRRARYIEVYLVYNALLSDSALASKKGNSLLGRQTLRGLVSGLSAMFLWRRSERVTGILFWRRWPGWQMTSCRYFLKFSFLFSQTEVFCCAAPHCWQVIGISCKLTISIIGALVEKCSRSTDVALDFF
jgi:hypothetical protein